MWYNEYNIILLVAALLGVAVAVICLLNQRVSFRESVLIIVGGGAALLISYALSVLVDVGLRPDVTINQVTLFDLSFGKQYYFTLILFWCLFSIICYNLKLDAARCCDTICPAAVTYALISRFACLAAGCCGGREIGWLGDFVFHVREAEILFSILFIFLSVFKNKGSARRYIIFYSIFRLVTEFARVETGQITLWILTVNQLLAIVVIVFFLIMGNQAAKPIVREG